jgi:hypothetical protein
MRTLTLTASTAGLALIAVTGVLAAQPEPPAAASATKRVSVRITGGHVTDSRDSGRPVRLIAAALGVPTAVFREAFSKVTPAAGGEEPDPAQVERNKAALLETLAPYGVTNARLDEVSNYYRYVESAGEVWKQRAAVAKATIRNGRVVALTIVDGGAGYSSTPRVTVPGFPSAKVKVRVAYGTSLATNGQVRSLSLR